MDTRHGLKQLYDKFEGGRFSGEPLRTKMIEISGAGPNPGWQAAIHLSRLVRSGYVEVVREDPSAKAKWGHTYQLTDKAFDALGVGGRSDPSQEELEAQHDRVVKYRDLILSSGGKCISKDWFIDPDKAFALRLCVVSEWVKLGIRVTPDGREMLAEFQTEAEGKA